MIFIIFKYIDLLSTHNEKFSEERCKLHVSHSKQAHIPYDLFEEPAPTAGGTYLQVEGHGYAIQL